MSPICPQNPSVMEALIGTDPEPQSEDCLALNVWTSGITSEPKPVMVWIHGGGFTSGDGSDGLFGPDFLLDRDVILVTLNYRLGPLGFFSLDDAGISGNQGMWDQREAMIW